MSELLLQPQHRYAKIIENTRNEDGSELSILNLGPTHPATHGIFQNILLMDGERIVDAEPTIGYIHRAFEKIAERRPFYLFRKKEQARKQRKICCRRRRKLELYCSRNWNQTERIENNEPFSGRRRTRNWSGVVFETNF